MKGINLQLSDKENRMVEELKFKLSLGSKSGTISKIIKEFYKQFRLKEIEEKENEK